MRLLRMCNWGPCWVKGALARCTEGSGMELLSLSRYALLLLSFFFNFFLFFFFLGLRAMTIGLVV